MAETNRVCPTDTDKKKGDCGCGCIGIKEKKANRPKQSVKNQKN